MGLCLFRKAHTEARESDIELDGVGQWAGLLGYIRVGHLPGTLSTGRLVQLNFFLQHVHPTPVCMYNIIYQVMIKTTWQPVHSLKRHERLFLSSTTKTSLKYQRLC